MKLRLMFIVMIFGATAVPWSVALANPQPGRGGEDPDWLKITPNDARFYVEIRDLSGIRRTFQKLGIWETVRELTEQSDPRATTQPWQRATEKHLGLDADAAISELLGRRTALIASESGRWQSGLIVAEMESAADSRSWPRRWRSVRLPNEGPVERHELPGGILLAASDRTLVFGPAGDAEGLWGRTALLLSGRRGPTLAGKSEFAALRSRLSREYPALFYAVWPPGDPSALEGCTRLLIGAAVTESGIVCELHGQRPAVEEQKAGVEVALLQALPASTLAVWAGSYDFAGLAEQIMAGRFANDASLIPLILASFSRMEDAQGEQLRNLGPRYLVVVDRDAAAGPGGFEMPAVAAVCEGRSGDALMQRMDAVLSLFGQLIALLAGPATQAAEQSQVKHLKCEGVEVHYIEAGPMLAKRTGLSFLWGVKVCWTFFDGRLVFSTSVDHCQAIIRAARGKSPRLGDSPGLRELLPSEADRKNIVEWGLVRGSAVAGMCASWLDYMQRESPQTLERTWWQNWALDRVKEQTRLGVGLMVEAPGKPEASVVEITDDSPAAGFLRMGDVIVGAGGSPLTATQPAQEIADRYRARGIAREFEFQVLRDGKPMRLVIPVPPAELPELQTFDPIRSLRQSITLSRTAEVVTAARYATKPDRFDARIDIRWQKP